MLEILSSPDHVGAYRLDGVLAEEDYDRVVADTRLDRFDRIGIVADLTGFRDLTVRGPQGSALFVRQDTGMEALSA